MAVCFCIFGLWTGAAQARDITFDLRDANGPVTQKSYPGKYLLLAIGYTSCPDICPTTLYEYGLVMKALKNPDAIQPINKREDGFVFVIDIAIFSTFLY